MAHRNGHEWSRAVWLGAISTFIAICGCAPSRDANDRPTPDRADAVCEGSPSVDPNQQNTILTDVDGYSLSIAVDPNSVTDSATLTGPEGTVQFALDDTTGDVTINGDALAGTATPDGLISNAQQAFSNAGDCASIPPDTNSTAPSSLASADVPLPSVRCAQEGVAFSSASDKVNSAALTTLAATWLHTVGTSVGIAWLQARQARSDAAAVLGACCYQNDSNFESYYCNQVYWLYWPLSVPGKP